MAHGGIAADASGLALWGTMFARAQLGSVAATGAVKDRGSGFIGRCGASSSGSKVVADYGFAAWDSLG